MINLTDFLTTLNSPENDLLPEDGLLAISGGPSSGRSTHLSNHFNTCQTPKLLVTAATPLSQWTQDANFQAWCNATHTHKLKVSELAEQLPLYVANEAVALFIDDIDKVTGLRKIDILKRCITAAKSVSYTCIEEGKMIPSVRLLLENRATETGIKHIKLKSNAPYDMTALLVGVLIVLATLLGYHEAAIILGGLLVLSRGPRATRTA